MTTETSAIPVEGAEAPVGTQDVVSHESFKKVLAEKKAMQAKLAEFEAAQEAATQAQMAEQKRFEELWKVEESRRVKAEELIEGIKKEKIRDKKRSAALTELGLKREEFLKFVDLDAIPVDDEGNVDSNAVKSFAADFRVKYPELVVEHKAPPPTNVAPSKQSGVVTVNPKDPKALLEIFKQTRA
jgi:hypothetical protein